MISVKSAYLAGLLVLAALTANAQTYWSTNAALNCGAYGINAAGAPQPVTTPAGGTGYVCFVYGTLPWYDAGGGWGSSIRVAAPATAPIAVFLDFVDVNAQPSTLDFQYLGDSTILNGTTTGQALFANQPMEVDLLGLHTPASNGSSEAKGPVVVLAYCPDPDTCSQVQAQLIYSALPGNTWSLSAPVVFDSQTWTAWSSVGIDDGSTNQVSFVIYNLANDKLAHTYTLKVFDSAGNLHVTATTQSVAYLGSYADLLRNVTSNLPTGVFKLQMVASDYAAFEALQFRGATGTTMVSAWENIPAGAAVAAAVTRGRHPAPTGRYLLPPQRVAQQ